MRAAILLATLLIVGFTACDKQPDAPVAVAGDLPAANAAGNDDTSVATVSATDLEDGGQPAAEIDAPMNTVPNDWMAEVPVYQNGEVVFGESNGPADARAMSLMIETLDAVSMVGDFYSQTFAEDGYRRLDTRVGPEFINNTWLINGYIVDVAIHHVPDDLMKMAVMEDPEWTADFEGSLIHIQIIKALETTYLTGAVSWYGMDDVPDGFPLNTMPRYPGGEIVMASFGGEHTVLQQICDDDSIGDAVEYYSDLFVSQGREMVVDTEEDNTLIATFTDNTGVVHLTVIRNTEGDTRVSINIYQADNPPASS